MKWKLILISLFSSFLLLGCGGVSGGGSGNGGGGTETGDPGAVAKPDSGIVGGATVLDESSNISVSSVAVWLDDNSMKKSYSKSNGDYIFYDVPAGEHVVYARWRYQDVVYVGKSKKLEIASSKGSLKPYIYLGQDIVLSEGANISGTIEKSTAYDVANLKVSLKDTHYKTKVNADGVFVLEELIEGEYILEVKNGSKVLFSLDVTVNAGDNLELGIVSK